MSEPASSQPQHFISQIIADDLASGRVSSVITRFPPEPNGYLHIGHAKSICLNFGMAQTFGGRCHLRFDDTNPAAEEVEYVESIQHDVRWLGFDWDDHLYYASNNFERLYAFAVELIKQGKAYVCALSSEEFKACRGIPTEPGKPSPYRDQPVEEALDLFARMRAGEFEEGSRVLRAKVDMASPNLHLRDPAMYRIKRASHHRTGDTWCIYPTYDFAHGLCDALEHITHSICTLEFEVHRPLYDWFIENLSVPARPRQYEFARLNLSYTVMSKRKLLRLVQEKKVSGWDDPRMPTIAGMRRRGYPPEAVRAFCEKIGVTKYNGLTDKSLLEHCVRDQLNREAPRVMGVMRPLKVVIENYPEGQVEALEAVNNPEDPSAGVRQVPFSRVIYIEQDDFMEDPPKKFFRLGPGREVRLRYAYFITCQSVVKDANGQVVELRCTYDPATRGGDSPDGRKVKGTLHWVAEAGALRAPVRLYDHLFSVERPDDVAEGGDFTDHLNPASLETVEAWLEPSLKAAAPGERYQFERLGYFCADAVESRPDHPVFNRIVALKDTWGVKSGK